jgi:predicted Fe-Mo cluster-binding NifX family protein
MTTDRLPGKVENGIFRSHVAIACFGEEVAPCFDTARRFRYWVIVDGEAVDYRELEAEGSEGISRVKLLKRVEVDVLICNGITERLQEMLEADGCVVIDGVLGSASDALFGLLAGQIKPRPQKVSLKPEQRQPHTADLVTWTEELFQKLGWRVRKVLQDSMFPIDLLAEKSCPVCGKPVRAAICCGAHAYRIEEEIQELRRIAAASYNARVYVHHAVPGVSHTCRDFEIDLLDPDDFTNGDALKNQGGILPPLKGYIAGHEALNKL